MVTMSDDEAVAGEGFEAGVQEEPLEDDLELTDDKAGEVKGGGSYPTVPTLSKPAAPGSPPPFSGS